MRNSRFILSGCVVAVAMLVAPAVAWDANPLFDRPLKVVHVPLPPDKDNPDAKREVRCSYYAHFVVKEIDSGEVDADQLSILPAKEDRPCRQANAPDERIVSANDWSGYFDGTLGNYVVFVAGDGWNGGLGFAVFTPDARKLFEDVAKDWTSARIVRGQRLELRYVRVYGAKCSLGDKAATACWKTITAQTGLNAPMPDCAALYVKEQRRTPKFAKEVLADPAAVEYAAVTTVEGHTVHVAAVSGKPARCAPQE